MDFPAPAHETLFPKSSTKVEVCGESNADFVVVAQTKDSFKDTAKHKFIFPNIFHADFIPKCCTVR